jgi:hypothetical protein
VFPDSEDLPAWFFEGSVDALVALAIGGEFGFPEGAVLGGEGGVSGAGVPEAAVDEEGDFLLGEDEVGFAEEFGVSAPAGDANGAEDGYESMFGGGVGGGADAWSCVRRALR